MKSLQYLADILENDKPFTLTYSAQTGHNPIETDGGPDDGWLNPPRTFPECELVADDDMYKPRSYMCNKVKYLDMIWGEFIQRLKHTGLWENTIVFVTSDNGGLPFVGADKNGGWGCNWPLRGTKQSYLEGGIKVWGGMWGGALPEDMLGTTHDGLTHIVDIAATAMWLSASKTRATELDLEGKGINYNMKKLDGVNLFELESHDLLVHNVIPQFHPDWIYPKNMDYAATDGIWKFWSGLP